MFAILPGMTGDFDGDGQLTGADIDRLSAVLLSGGNGAEFDLNGDGLITSADRSLWIDELALTLVGDLDLNATVDFADFVVLSTHFGQAGGWAAGDFDGSGRIEFPDFLLLAENYGRAAVRIANVPESDHLALAVVGSVDCLPSTVAASQSVIGDSQSTKVLGPQT